MGGIKRRKNFFEHVFLIKLYPFLLRLPKMSLDPQRKSVKWTSKNDSFADEWKHKSFKINVFRSTLIKNAIIAGVVMKQNMPILNNDLQGQLRRPEKN